MLQETNGPIVNILKAVLKAQSTIPEIEKKSVADMKTYKYRYADLADIQRAIRKPLIENDLFFVHNIIYQDSKEFLVTRLMHISGEYLQSVNVLLDCKDPQDKATLLTYYRRYAICGLLDLCTDEDIDGKVQDAKKQPNQAIAASQIQNTAKPQGSAQNSTGGPTEKQLNRLFAISKQHNWSQENIRAYSKEVFNIDSSKKLTKTNYELLCKVIEENDFNTAMSKINKDSEPEFIDEIQWGDFPN